MRSPNVLIVSTKVDSATDEVVRHLRAQGIPHYRLNTEDYPFAKTIAHFPNPDAAGPWLECDNQTIPVPSSIWYRRVRTSGTPEGMDEGISDFCRHETRAVLLGSIVGVRTRWMSHPSAVWQAEYKPFQLDLAASLGLRIPRTVITNAPSVIRDFYRTVKRMAVKPARTGHVVREGIEYAIYTSEVLNEHLEELECARLSPAIYQELIEKQYDVRVAIVGNRCFSAAIDSQSDPHASLDWRRTVNPHLPHHRIELPAQLRETLLKFMRCLRLKYGAIDLIRTPTGEYVFLEVNPSGQWLWLDDMLDLRISNYIAHWLAKPYAPKSA